MTMRMVTKTGKIHTDAMHVGMGGWVEGTAGEAIARSTIVYEDTLPVTGTAFSSLAKGFALRRKFKLATNATKLKAHGALYVALNKAASGTQVIVAPLAEMNNLDTSGGALGDPVFLSTAGLPTLTRTGFQRKIGQVTGVGASGTGCWAFTGGKGIDEKYVMLDGVAAVAGAASVTVLAATIGGSFGGAPANAVCTTVDGVKSVTACTWSTNDLVITLSASYTGNVQWYVWV